MMFYIAIIIVAIFISGLIKFHIGVSKIKRKYDENLAFQDYNIKQEFSDRKVENLRILTILTDYFIEHPEIRFIQSLYNLNILAEDFSYNEEPKVTLEKIEKVIKNRS